MGFFELFAGALSGFYALIPSYGVAIILLTIVVRALLLPLSIKQTRSMREMQRIQPEIKRLQAKHKGDRQKLNEELMALYKEHSVNPFGGCLPLLMQIPVFFGLFYVIRQPLEYLGFMKPEGTPKDTIVPPGDFVPESVSGLMETIQNSRLADDLMHRALETNGFLGIRLDCSATAAMSSKDVSATGAVCGDGFLSALPYVLLIIGMGFTLFYQQRQMQASSTASGQQAQQMQLMGKIMPVLFMFFGVNFPAGLLVYWVTTNVWTIGQQYLMLHVAPPVAGGDGSKGAGKGSDKDKVQAGPRTKSAAKAPPTGRPKSGSQGDKQPLAKRSPSAKKKRR